jgi:hypothetical protein
VSVLFGDSFTCCVYSDQKPVHQERGNRRAVAYDEITTATNISPKYQEGHSDGFAWDVRWQGLKPNLLQFVYGPTKVVP